MKIIIAIILSVILAGCGFDGSMRYPCQAFENWEKPECNPPQCEATGICTKDLLPSEIFEGTDNG